MSVQKLSPYIHFNGTAAKAIRLYESALGAKTVHVMHYNNAPGCEVPPDHAGLIMHACLQIGGGEIMLNDTTPDKPAPAESNMQIALQFADIAEMTKAFDALAAGGNVVMPIQDTFWGAKFGLLTDVYGIRWMFNCEIE